MAQAGLASITTDLSMSPAALAAHVIVCKALAAVKPKHRERLITALWAAHAELDTQAAVLVIHAPDPRAQSQARADAATALAMAIDVESRRARRV